MRADNFFPPRPESKPTIYAYEDTNPQYADLLKVGYTTVDAQFASLPSCTWERALAPEAPLREPRSTTAGTIAFPSTTWEPDEI